MKARAVIVTIEADSSVVLKELTANIKAALADYYMTREINVRQVKAQVVQATKRDPDVNFERVVRVGGKHCQ